MSIIFLTVSCMNANIILQVATPIDKFHPLRGSKQAENFLLLTCPEPNPTPRSLSSYEHWQPCGNGVAGHPIRHAWFTKESGIHGSEPVVAGSRHWSHNVDLQRGLCRPH